MKFKFKKDELVAKSGMFRDMFEVAEAGEGVAEVPVTESSRVLEAVLRVSAQGRVGLDDLVFLSELDDVSDKYQVSQVPGLLDRGAVALR